MTDNTVVFNTMAEPRYKFHVDVRFTSNAESLEFTDDDYRYFGCGDIERGKHAVDALLETLAKRIDAEVLSDK